MFGYLKYFNNDKLTIKVPDKLVKKDKVNVLLQLADDSDHEHAADDHHGVDDINKNS